MKPLPLLTDSGFRHFATMILPSSLAVSTWLYPPVALHWKEALTWAEAHWAASLAMFICSYAIVGLVLEMFSSCVEAWLFDRIREKIHKGHGDEWEKYLRIAFEVEPIGQRYIRSILARFKIELALAVACISASIGGFVHCNAVTGWAFLAIALLTGCEAWSSHGLMARTRRSFLEEGVILMSSPSIEQSAK